MCRLHGLLNDFQQLLTQLVQIHLIAQGRTEGCKGTSGIIPGAVEPPVDNGLKTSSQWLEQSSNAKRIRIYRQSKRHFLVVPFPSMYRTIFVSHDGVELVLATWDIRSKMRGEEQSGKPCSFCG